MNGDPEGKECLSAWILSSWRKSSQKPPRGGVEWDLTSGGIIMILGMNILVLL